MRTIFSIFGNDIRSIVRHPLVLVVILAVGVIPSLYAWINLYADWDPYGKADDLQIALASRDRGIDRTNGTHVNRAEEVITRVCRDTHEGFRPVDDPDEALEGVRAGKYYAAIIFEDGFTYDMEHFDKAIGDRSPKLIYYPNIKKNAIATKITDGSAEDLQEEINRTYLETVLGDFFADTEELSDRLDTDEAVDEAIDQLIEAREALHSYNTAITQYLASSGDISRSLKDLNRDLDSDRSKGKSTVKKATKAYNEAKKSADELARQIRNRTAQLDGDIDALAAIAAELKKSLPEEERQKLIEEGEVLADRILAVLENLRAMIPGDGDTPAFRMAAATLDLMIDTVKKIKSDLREPSRIDALVSEMDALKKINQEELVPAMDLIVSDIRNALKLVKPLMSAADGTLGDIDPVLKSAGKTVNGLDKTMIRLQAMTVPLEEKLDQVIDEVEKADREDRLEVLTRVLGGDPEEYVRFFTDPVEVSTENFYRVPSYGAAMAPFFTIIALWVGAVMILTVLRAGINRELFPEATESQAFFGRALILLLIGQMQAAVVVAGNIFLLHVDPVHPVLTWFSAAVASFVFVLLVYAMILSFGNIGRGLVIVIMVLQVAGSSGSYPIELLPVIFSKIYIFFPFPSAINAMREAMFGLYRADYLVYLGQLLIFALVALAIGLLIRKPFIGVDRYVTEKLEETEVL
ncbi:MAG: YhgE/Pip domain-containing protein [Firmicutes bacterium]|nr:YhgE/Pip domain-containing protein [Bacillota bacterium]